MNLFENSPYECVPLAEVVIRAEIRDPRKSPEKPFRYVDISSVSNDTFQILNGRSIKGADPPSRARKVIRAKDVVFATTRPYLKSIALVPEDLDDQMCSTGFCVLRSSPRILPEWLFLCTTSDEFMRQITPLMRGA